MFISYSHAYSFILASDNINYFHGMIEGNVSWIVQVPLYHSLERTVVKQRLTNASIDPRLLFSQQRVDYITISGVT